MNYNIMISNDDGVKSVGIDALARYAQRLGDVKIVAPDRQQTARAKALTFHKPIRIEKTTSVSGIPAIAYDSPPAVSVIIYEHFNKAPDIVISGINAGDNASLHSILTSGTAAVAMEAGMKKIPAFAFSMDVPDELFFGNEIPGSLEVASKLAILIVEEFMKESDEFLNSFMFLNINFPKTLDEITPVEFAELEYYKYDNYLVEREDPSSRKYFWLWGSKREDFHRDSDAYKLYNDKVTTITPVSFTGVDKDVHRHTKEVIDRINRIKIE